MRAKEMHIHAPTSMSLPNPLACRTSTKVNLANSLAITQMLSFARCCESYNPSVVKRLAVNRFPVIDHNVVLFASEHQQPRSFGSPPIQDAKDQG